MSSRNRLSSQSEPVPKTVVLRCRCLLAVRLGRSSPPDASNRRALPPAPRPYPAFTAAYAAGDRVVPRRQDHHRVDGDVGQGGIDEAARTDRRGFRRAAIARGSRGVPPFGKPVFVLVARGGQGHARAAARGPRAARRAARSDRRGARRRRARSRRAADRDQRLRFRWRRRAEGAHVSRTAGSPRRPRDGDTYLRKGAAGWEVAAATRGPVTVTYADYASGRPATIRIRAGRGDHADITLRLSDVDINTTLDPKSSRSNSRSTDSADAGRTASRWTVGGS